MHEKEEFFDKLFFTGTFINSNYEQIRQLILNLNEKSNIKYTVDAITGYKNSIKNLLTGINFEKFTPFFTNTKTAKLTKQVQALFFETENLIISTIQNIRISNSECEITTLKINSTVSPCLNCTVTERQQHSQADCPKLMEYKTTLEKLLKTLDEQTKETISFLKKLYRNTEIIQTEYLKAMNELHRKTKNKTRWKETIEANRKYISETMKDYVEKSINKV